MALRSLSALMSIEGSSFVKNSAKASAGGAVSSLAVRPSVITGSSFKDNLAAGVLQDVYLQTSAAGSVFYDSATSPVLVERRGGSAGTGVCSCGHELYPNIRSVWAAPDPCTGKPVEGAVFDYAAWKITGAICTRCTRGRFAAASSSGGGALAEDCKYSHTYLRVVRCVPRLIDDMSAVTMRVAPQQQSGLACAAGRYGQKDGSTNARDCAPCEAGSSSLPGSTACSLCFSVGWRRIIFIVKVHPSAFRVVRS